MKWNNRIMNTRQQKRALRAGKIGWSLLIGLIFAGMGINPLQAAELLSVDHTVGSDNSVTITLTTDALAADPAVFSTDNPARIVLDLPDTRSNLSSVPVSVSIGRVGQYATLSAGGRTRLVVDLNAPSSYEIDTSGSEVTLKIASGASASTAVTSLASSAGSNTRL